VTGSGVRVIRVQVRKISDDIHVVQDGRRLPRIPAVPEKPLTLKDAKASVASRECLVRECSRIAESLGLCEEMRDLIAREEAALDTFGVHVDVVNLDIEGMASDDEKVYGEAAPDGRDRP
jgi:hypothetical protein